MNIETEKAAFNEMLKLGESISKILNRNFHPHMTIVITSENVQVEETLAGFPVPIPSLDDDTDKRSL